jgi:hypothetical protein
VGVSLHDIALCHQQKLTFIRKPLVVWITCDELRQPFDFSNEIISFFDDSLHIRLLHFGLLSLKRIHAISLDQDAQQRLRSDPRDQQASDVQRAERMFLTGVLHWTSYFNNEAQAVKTAGSV